MQLWDLATGKRLWQIKHKRPRVIHAVVFSPNCKLLAAGDDTGKISVVTAADGKELRRWTANLKADDRERGTHSLAFSPDGKTLASGEDDGAIYFWDPLTGKKVRELRGHRGAVYSIAFSPDGRALASASQDRTLRVWDTATGRESPAFDGHDDSVHSLAFSPDGKVLVTGGLDSTVRLWDPESGEQLQLLSGYESAFYSPNGKLLVASNGAGIFHLRESATGRQVRSLEAPQHYLMAFHPDGRTIASAGFDPVIRFWDASTGKERRRFSLTEKSKWVEPIAFSPDGHLLAYVGDGPFIRLCDWAEGREVRGFSVGHERIECFSFAPDGHSLATGGHDGMVRFWRVQDGEERLHWKADERDVEAIAFSPDGRFVASSGTDIRLWEVATGKEICRLGDQRGRVWVLAFSPDGRQLASGSTDFAALVWDIPAALGKDAALPSDPEQCWKDLTAADPRVAYRAVWGLAKLPAKSLPMLRERMRPVPAVSQARIDRLLADLDDDDFAVRSKSTAALEELGEVAESSLRKVLRGSPSPEVRQRAEKLIAKVAAPVPPVEQLRLLRALATLEEIGTPDAHRLVKSLANGAPDARLTQEARTLLERRAQRSSNRLPNPPTRDTSPKPGHDH